MSKTLATGSKIKQNEALFTAFFNLAKHLGLAVAEGDKKTSHGYDQIKVGNKAFCNALCVKKSSITFFTSDKNLLRRLSDPSTGLVIIPSPSGRRPSPHNEYRFEICRVTLALLEKYSDDFTQIVKDSVAYVENPIAGNDVHKS